MTSEYKPEIKELLSSGGYSLKSGVFLVEGFLRCALYDINSGNVYSLDKNARDVLTGQSENTNFWRKLVEMGLCTNNSTGEKPMLGELEYKPSLRFVWFEITSKRCNERCLHCYGDFMPLAFQEKNRPESQAKLTYDQWKDQIKAVYDLGCETCQFIGGEPFLYRGENSETVLELAEYAKGLGYKFVEIFTNAILLTQDKVDRIKALGINVAVSLYSIDPEVHDEITRTPGSYKKTMKALEMLSVAGVPTRVETVLMKQNEESAEKTQKLIDEMGFSHKRIDVLRQNGRGDNQGLLPSNDSLLKYGIMTSPNFSTNKEALSKNLYNNSCLSGKIAITDNGDVIPCVFSRDEIVGNIHEKPISRIMEEVKLKNVWENTKDSVQVCRDCEYRYCCTDCRPSSLGVNREMGDYLTAPYPKCAYNPYEGKWGKGYWKLDFEEKPVYINILEGGENNEN